MTSQAKVALLFIFACLSAIIFVSFLGQWSPFGNYKKLIVAYNFVGGLEKGSHVRLMGVKVGKVEKVEFKPDYQSSNGEEVKLHIHIKVQDKAWAVIREDSRYYINMAGIIGEKYLEITPGQMGSPKLEEGRIVRGTDPPRVDQLISQGYALAGKILSIVEDNEESVTGTLGSLSQLVTSLNKALQLLNGIADNPKADEIVDQIQILGSEMTILLKDANKGNIKEVMSTMKKLLTKLEAIEEKDVRDFLQVEGIKARVSL